MYKVVHITKNLKDYPECEEDTKTYPHLIPYIDDETDIFIIDDQNINRFWLAQEFFFMVDVRKFEVLTGKIEK